MYQLMEKDYRIAVRGGFEGTGIYPVNVQKALDRLRKEDREVTSAVHSALLKQLQEYGPGGVTHARKPSKKDRLPAGTAYTCPPGGDCDDNDSDDNDSEQ